MYIQCLQDFLPYMLCVHRGMHECSVGESLLSTVIGHVTFFTVNCIYRGTCRSGSKPPCMMELDSSLQRKMPVFRGGG